MKPDLSTFHACDKCKRRLRIVWNREHTAHAVESVCVECSTTRETALENALRRLLQIAVWDEDFDEADRAEFDAAHAEGSALLAPERQLALLSINPEGEIAEMIADDREAGKLGVLAFDLWQAMTPAQRSEIIRARVNEKP